MKRSWICAGLVLALCSPIAKADWSFEGQWFNMELFTGGIAVLETSHAGTNLMLYAGGACNPTDCPWGPTAMTVIHDPGGMTNDVATATFDFGFETDALTMMPQGNNLFVTNFNSQGFSDSYLFSQQPPVAIHNFGTNLAIIWPYEATSFTLQVSTNLAPPASWITATNPIAVQTFDSRIPRAAARDYSVAFDVSSTGPIYYRLRR